ncbi:MAG: SIR2 family protein [Bacteroidales bacterium]|nr:SIR2 family protein [Bacteroidales bacterium]
MEKRVILMGAGAAYLHNGPSCSTITQTLVDKLPICADIYSILTEYYGKNRCNFETILASIEYLLYSTERLYGETLYSDTLIPVFYERKTNYSEQQLKETFIETINIIINLISSYSTQRSEEIDKLLLEYIDADNFSTKVYSLNYDRIIPLIYEKNNINFCDGTNPHGAFRCSIEEFINHTKTFYNLHGNIYLKQNPWLLYEVTQGTNVHFLSQLRELEGGNPHNRTYFSPIISGYSKTQRLLSQPFSYGLACFAHDLQDCTRLDIVGYSFSDPHINSMLKSFGEFSNKEVNIIDYIPQNLNVEFKIEEIAQDLSWYYRRLPNNWLKEGNSYIFGTHRLRIYIDGFESYLKSIQSTN